MSYLAGVDAALIVLGEHESLASNVQTLGESLVDGGLVAAHNACNVLHLLGADLLFPPNTYAGQPSSCPTIVTNGPSDLPPILGSSYRVSCSGCPSAVASNANDGALVNVTGADKAEGVGALALSGRRDNEAGGDKCSRRS